MAQACTGKDPPENISHVHIPFSDRKRGRSIWPEQGLSFIEIYQFFPVEPACHVHEKHVLT